MAFLLLTAGILAVTAVEAGAVTCPNNTHFAPATWTPSGASGAAYGVRAPIVLRAGASLCGTSSDADSVGSWIAIEPGSSNRISQMGFVYLYTDATTKQLCRFWAASAAGTVHKYKCGDDTPGDTVYFKITTLLDSSSRYYYQLSDCGTSGSYSGCTVKDTNEDAYSNPYSLVSAEANRGGCADTIQGRPLGSKVSYGNSSSPLQAQNSYGGGWATRNYQEQSVTCGHFNVNVSTDHSVVTTWDTGP